LVLLLCCHLLGSRKATSKEQRCRARVVIFSPVTFGASRRMQQPVPIVPNRSIAALRSSRHRNIRFHRFQQFQRCARSNKRFHGCLLLVFGVSVSQRTNRRPSPFMRSGYFLNACLRVCSKALRAENPRRTTGRLRLPRH
jgi:hypothetical protein